MPDPSLVLPNTFSPYADADPLYRHLITVFLPSLFGEPKPGTLTVTSCERLAVVPAEPLTVADEPDQELPTGLCPLCLAVMSGEQPAPRYPSGPCRRCEVITSHNGLCAQCRQEQHADWWQASDTWARPFRLILRGKQVLDGAVFPNGQAVVIDDPEAGLSSGAATLEQLLAGYHRAEVMLAEDVIRVGTARVAHAVGEYTRVAIELEDTERERDEHKRDYLNACATIAAMHKAAVGEVRGPTRGVVEDVEDVRAAVERARERCQAVRDRVGPGGMINASQILGLLSPTWPDGNHEVPTPADAPSQPVMTGHHHYGRAWVGHEIEDACPCIKAPCGLVAQSVPECTQHRADKSTRQSHPAASCPGPDQTVAVPRTERSYWVDIAAALNAAVAAGLPVGVDLDGTLTDHSAWSVIWDPSAERWTVAGYENEGDDTPCTCTVAEACDQCSDDDQDDEPEETGDADGDVLQLISEIAGRLSDATDEGEYQAVGLISDLANGRKTIAEARAELADITFRHV
ncbi:hypothetical protein [Streptomyces sp. NPDC057877]|uniref:hypothetical protein n=1 Tax=Streptomyces sp. NPDC057877 TaxID=3346269 RepID=UPI003679A999